jgi:ATP adenylyltransferase
MKYTELLDFLKNKMRLSHIYQPVMIKALLTNNGELTDVRIASELLKYDISQIEYYQKITSQMVGKVLLNRQVVYKEGRKYILPGYTELMSTQIDDLVRICEEQIDLYIKKRGSAIWNHRKKSKGYISGSIKYEVLKRANFRCELCGISANEKALEVDHIVPRNSGGEDSINNYQALCYSFNATKRDTDSTDFRQKINYEEKSDSCVFCNMNSNIYTSRNNLAFSIKDNYPVTNLHSLVIPKRHVDSFFELTQAELNSIFQLLEKLKNDLTKVDIAIQGFNIGINQGNAAGQTINHCHIHLIPRRDGDVKNPQGGIRHVIPEKGFY